MRKTLIVVMALTSMFSVCRTGADTVSKAYTEAAEKGDNNAAYRAQSYLAPPYCYDLNRWLGVKFIKAVNGRVVQPAYPFIYQDMAHLKVRKLYDRAGIA
ncbi:hypothetical protein LLG96_09425, partial [bacterium]|nr:hypothetical protein [bacterium]